MTQLAVKVGGSWANVTNVMVKVASTWRQVQNVKVKVAGTWQTVWNLFTVDYPSLIDGYAAGFATHGDVSSDAYANPTYVGGSGSYTWSWVKTGGDASVGISNATSQKPGFSASNVPDGDPATATYQVTVTDTITGAVDSDTVNISLMWTNLT